MTLMDVINGKLQQKPDQSDKDVFQGSVYKRNSFYNLVSSDVETENDSTQI